MQASVARANFTRTWTVRGSRFAGALALILALAGCIAHDIASGDRIARAGNWRIEQQSDRVTGQQVASAFISAGRTTSSRVVFPQPALLQLTCFRGGPLAKFVFFTPLGADRNSTFSYRFDETPGHETEARFLQDHRTVVIEEPQSAALFLAGLANADTLYVRARSLNAASAGAEFKVTGAAEAAKQALAGCPPVPLATPAPAAAPATAKRAGT
jgi:hypothetical protein